MNPIPGPFDPVPRAIFIDFDGVLHDADAGELALGATEMLILGESLFEWAPLLAAALDGVEDLAVVVHSSWRSFHTDDELRAKLPGSLGRLFAGATHTRMSRHESVLAWIADHGVRSFLILDDMPKEFPEEMPELAACDPKRGVSDPRIMGRVARFLASSKAD